MPRKRARGTGSIYQRPDGRWCAEVVVGMDGDRIRRKFVYGRTKADVVAKLGAVQGHVRDGRPLPDERRLTGDFLDSWLEDVVKRRREHATYVGYEQRVRLYLKPELGRIPLARLSVEDIERVLRLARDADLSPRSVQYLHATIRAALAVAERRGYVARNVAKLVEPISLPRREIEPYTRDEVHRLLVAAEREPLGSFFTVSVALGLRPEEALGLAWTDLELDGDRPRLSVRQVVKRSESGLVVVPRPKTDRSRRTLPLPAAVVDAFARRRTTQAAERAAAGSAWQDSGLVFTTGTGRPVDHRFIARVWDRVQNAAGVDRRRLYDTRHTAATLLLAEGVQARVLMEVLGHSTYQLTMNTYAHVMPALLDDAAEAMDRVLRNGPEPPGLGR